jgi:flagellar assembly protein FliH
MALKIIKSGTTRALNVQQFRFADDGGEPVSMTEPHVWPAPEGNPAVPPAKEVVPADSGKQSVDLALLEKTAYENGFLQGEKVGIDIAEQKIEAVMRRYGESILELGKLRSSLYMQVEREVVKLAVEVAKKIVHREIQVDKDIIQTLVRVALSHVAEKSAVTVHLSPQDHNHLLALRDELSQSEGRDISLLADKSIERGGCLIQTECGDIDARIEEKFREVEQAFFEGLK